MAASKTALIIGISGQDGSYLAASLVAKGYTVHGTSRDKELANFANLRTLGVSYVICGKKELDLPLVLSKLKSLFGIDRARVDGGGHVNGSFMKAGVVDEFSVVYAPRADGRSKTLASVEMGDAAEKFPAVHLKLKSVKKIFGDFVWARYDVVPAKKA